MRKIPIILQKSIFIVSVSIGATLSHSSVARALEVKKDVVVKDDTSHLKPAVVVAAVKKPLVVVALVKKPIVVVAPVKKPIVVVAPVKKPVVVVAPVKKPVVVVAPVKKPAVVVAPVKKPAVVVAPVSTAVVVSAPIATPVVVSAPIATPVVVSPPVATPVVVSAPIATPVVVSAPASDAINSQNNQNTISDLANSSNSAATNTPPTSDINNTSNQGSVPNNDSGVTIADPIQSADDMEEYEGEVMEEVCEESPQPDILYTRVEPVAEPPATVEPPADPIGMLSYYGTSNDPYGDSQTAAGVGVQNIPLTTGDIALSKGLENSIRDQGGDVGSDVLVTLADGTILRGRFTDRVPASCTIKGKKVMLKRPRVDIYRPDLNNNNLPPSDHSDVVSITPINTD